MQMHSSRMVLMGLWLSSWSCKLKTFMHRWEDTRAQMSMLSSLKTYPSQCFHLCCNCRFFNSI
ncbi:hypothetical protein AAZV13_02G101350 [Glycine max]